MSRETAGLAKVNATAGETAEPDAGDPMAQEDSAVGQTAEPASSRQYQDGIQRAESVFPYDGGILISNFGGSQGGYVLYRKDGNTEMLIAPGEGLEVPTGLAAGNGMLFVCDGDVLKVFEIKDPGKGFCEIRLDGNSHLFNDVAIDGSYLYLSVTDQDAVYRMDIYGVVHIPSGTEERMPVVIMSHELGATLDRVKGYGEALTKEGYVTVCFDFSGGGWESRSDGEMLDMSVLTEKADLEAVLEEVKQWDFVDTGSIYLMGNSQGGFVTALTAAEHREEIRAVILIYPALCIY